MRVWVVKLLSILGGRSLKREGLGSDGWPGGKGVVRGVGEHAGGTEKERGRPPDLRGTRGMAEEVGSEGQGRG